MGLHNFLWGQSSHEELACLCYLHGGSQREARGGFLEGDGGPRHGAVSHHFLYPAGTSGGAYYATTSVVESVKKAQEETAAVILSRALQICKDKMVHAETLTMTGDPKDVICQATEQMHVDLLVVGSRGLGMVKRAFLGSVSDYCAHHAACPVVIVKPPRESAATK
ncbi:hypothetical protein M0R45_000097 [Rubus argutus]|uniref:UspA domain-containing protein n=1 Tax=Rubus argutus TaxID=59490 RepID=A0AAW1VQ57_RUBAR